MAEGPEAVYGNSCAGRKRCKGSACGRVVRVKRSVDRRTFLPWAQDSLKFERLYRARSAVEWVNSRLEVSSGLDDHFVRGLAKMRTPCVLRLITMPSMALGRARQSKRKAAAAATERAPILRSLVGAA